MELFDKLAKSFVLCSMKVAYKGADKIEKQKVIIYSGKRMRDLNLGTEEDKKVAKVYLDFLYWVRKQEE